MKNNIAYHIKNILNEWTKDPLILKDIQALIDARVPASISTQEHPHIQVNKDHEIGLLGILNGLIEDDSNILAANYNDDNKLINFDIMSSSSPIPNPHNPHEVWDKMSNEQKQKYNENFNECLQDKNACPLERYMQAQLELDDIRQKEDALLEQMDSIWKQLSTEQRNIFDNRMEKAK